MSVRVQVILEEYEAAMFRAEASKKGKSLSAWLREAGRGVLHQRSQEGLLKEPDSLSVFFKTCREREQGVESDWEDYKRQILTSSRGHTETFP